MSCIPLFSFSGICVIDGSSYSPVFVGKNEHETVIRFENWCVRNKPYWAHLFYQKTGVGVRSYFKGRGFVDFEG